MPDLLTAAKGGITKSQPLKLHQVLEFFSMPKGLRRFYGGGDLHFITCSCYQRKPFRGFASRRDLFLNIFEDVRVCHPDRARTTLSLPKGRRVRVEGSRHSFLRHADSGSSLENAMNMKNSGSHGVSFRAYRLGEEGPVRIGG